VRGPAPEPAGSARLAPEWKTQRRHRFLSIRPPMARLRGVRQQREPELGARLPLRAYRHIVGRTRGWGGTRLHLRASILDGPGKAWLVGKPIVVDSA
jgi:hypothetical protein